MIKQRLPEKLVDFQRDIMSLSQALQAKEQACRDGEDHLLLELMLVLDAFENIFNSLEDKAETFDKSMRRALTSFTRIQSKVKRILEARGVEQIAFPDGKAVVGLCKVVETQAVEGREAGGDHLRRPPRLSARRPGAQAGGGHHRCQSHFDVTVSCRSVQPSAAKPSGYHQPFSAPSMRGIHPIGVKPHAGVKTVIGFWRTPVLTKT